MKHPQHVAKIADAGIDELLFAATRIHKETTRAVPFAFAYGDADPGRTRRRRSHQQMAGPLITALLQLFGR